LGTSKGEFPDTVFDSILSQIGEIGSKGVGFNTVNTDLKVLIMDGFNEVWPRDVEDFIAAF
jgi:hypothetical protein